MLAVQGSKFESSRSALDSKTSRNPAANFSNVFENYDFVSHPPSPKRGHCSKSSFSAGKKDEVTIHVCDEGRKTSKYFICQRSFLIQHMKYFERFLAENESSYDLDISVHCDVEIFEWLMNYIHDPLSQPKLNKAIVVSILISSEFLQMESLVNVCLENIAARLHEIIKLPIDLSCISDKLINKLAALTHPKVLSQTLDRKDKILNKLYKRRVELDFSRRGGIRGSVSQSNNNNNNNNNNRAIAASLTCCKHCGTVYLENYASDLFCLRSAPVIGFRGEETKRHSAIAGWSLTTYLKCLHLGGMSWEAIYWHVWGACIVMRPIVHNKIKNGKGKDNEKIENLMISALDTDRYSLGPDEVLIYNRPHIKKNQSSDGTEDALSTLCDSTDRTQKDLPGAHRRPAFSLSREDDCSQPIKAVTMTITAGLSPQGSSPSSGNFEVFTPSLNPHRPPEIMTPEIFELLTSQAQMISGLRHKELLMETARRAVQNASSQRLATPILEKGNAPSVDNSDCGSYNYAEILWKDSRARPRVPDPPESTGGKESHLRSATMDLLERGRDRGRERARSATRVRKPQGRSSSRAKVPVSFSSTGGLTTHIKGIAYDSDKDSIVAKDDTVGPRPSTTLSSIFRDSSTGGDREKPWTQDSTAANINALTALPPDVVRMVEGGGGSLDGLWFTAHPLQLQPMTLVEAMQSVAENSKGGSPLSADKQLSWQLDLLREYDDQRMERYESFLSAKRSPSIEDQIRSRCAIVSRNAIGTSVGTRQSVSRRPKAAAVAEYYRDKGRQANK